MRLNAMTKCAVGAMMFTGVFGATQEASASLTWLNAYSPWQVTNYASAFIPNTFPPVVYHDTVGAMALGSETASYLGFGSVSYSATTQSGFSVSMTHNGMFSGRFYTQAVRFFEVSGTVDLSLSVAPQGSGSAQYSLARYGPNQVIASGTTLTSPLAWNGTLSTGIYSLSVQFETVQGGSAFSGEIASVIVPAPGALALLGAAGLVGKRRRR
jgi:hypothetical protein